MLSDYIESISVNSRELCILSQNLSAICLQSENINFRYRMCRVWKIIHNQCRKFRYLGIFLINSFRTQSYFPLATRKWSGVRPLRMTQYRAHGSKLPLRLKDDLRLCGAYIFGMLAFICCHVLYEIGRDVFIIYQPENVTKSSGRMTGSDTVYLITVSLTFEISLNHNPVYMLLIDV